MRIDNDDLISEGTPTDMADSFESVPILLQHIANYSIQLVFTGSPVGSLKLQLSNDMGEPTQVPPRSYQDVINWTDIVGSDQDISAAGNHAWNVENTGYMWVRFVYTSTSGSGTLTSARFMVKGI